MSRIEFENMGRLEDLLRKNTEHARMEEVGRTEEMPWLYLDEQLIIRDLVGKKTIEYRSTFGTGSFTKLHEELFRDACVGLELPHVPPAPSSAMPIARVVDEPLNPEIFRPTLTVIEREARYAGDSIHALGHINPRAIKRALVAFHKTDVSQLTEDEWKQIQRFMSFDEETTTRQISNYKLTGREARQIPSSATVVFMRDNGYKTEFEKGITIFTFAYLRRLLQHYYGPNNVDITLISFYQNAADAIQTHDDTSEFMKYKGGGYVYPYLGYQAATELLESTSADGFVYCLSNAINSRLSKKCVPHILSLLERDIFVRHVDVATDKPNRPAITYQTKTVGKDLMGAKDLRKKLLFPSIILADTIDVEDVVRDLFPEMDTVFDRLRQN